MTATQRPGVYSNYTGSGVLWGNGTNKDIGIVAVNDKSDVNVVYEIKRASDALAIFGSNGLMTRLCNIALSNGSNKIIAISAGNGSKENYLQAFNTISNVESVGAVVCDNETQEINQMLVDSVEQSSNNSKERIGIVACESDYIESFVDTVNSERIIALKQKAKDEVDDTSNGCFIAAAVAGTIAKSADPATSFNSISLKAINSLNETYDEDEINVLLMSGIAVFEIVAGSIELIRGVSTRTKTNGIDDITFHDINTVLIIDDIVSSIRNVLKNMISNAKNNQTTRVAISTQTSIELENKKYEGLIESYEQPNVYPDENDSSICIVELSFTVSHTLNQIMITAYIKV